MGLRGKESIFWISKLGFGILFFSLLTFKAQAARVLVINQRVEQAGSKKNMRVLYTGQKGNPVAATLKPGEYADLDKIVSLKIFMPRKNSRSKRLPAVQDVPIKGMDYAVVRMLDESSAGRTYSIKVEKASMLPFLTEMAKCKAGLNLYKGNGRH
jgi:hypothetical protein